MRRPKTLSLFVSLILSLLAPSGIVSCASSSASRPSQQSHLPAAKPLPQITAWNFDWDDNIMYMPTQIVLFEKGGKGEKAVSTEEFAHVRQLLGKPGPYQGYETRDDPSTGSFRYFRDSPKENYFLSDIKHALSNPKAQWEGPSWDRFVQALSNAVSAEWTTIITARGHSQRAMLEGIQYLRSKGLVRYLPRPENLFAVSDPRFKASASSPSQIKAEVMEKILDHVEKQPILDSAREVLTPDGNKKQRLHLWGFSDDDYGNYEKAIQHLSPLVKKGRWPHVKLTFFYTGKSHPQQKARVEVMTSQGALRARTAEEANEANAILHSLEQFLQP